MKMNDEGGKCFVRLSRQRQQRLPAFNGVADGNGDGSKPFWRQVATTGTSFHRFQFGNLVAFGNGLARFDQDAGDAAHLGD